MNLIEEMRNWSAGARVRNLFALFWSIKIFQEINSNWIVSSCLLKGFFSVILGESQIQCKIIQVSGGLIWSSKACTLSKIMINQYLVFAYHKLYKQYAIIQFKQSDTF